jgi:transposase
MNPVADIPNPSGLKLASLLALVYHLIAQIRQLWDEVTKLRSEIDQLKRKNARSAAPFSKNKHKKNPKRPGRKAGQGPFKNRSAPPEEQYSGSVEDVPVSETTCPECGGDMKDEEPEIVTNTEIPSAPKPEVKAYRIHIRGCCRCKHKVRGRHPDVAPDQHGATAHRLGPRAQAAAHTLHYDDGIPQRKVPQVLKRLSGLSVTQGAIAQSAIRLGTGDGPVAQRYQQLRIEIKDQKAINTDDTGWRIGGYLANLMAFDSRSISVYQIRPQHRNEEVREVIGNGYKGILGCDGGKSYDAKELLDVKQQKCLAHVLRLIDEALEKQRGPARFFGVTLKSLFKEAIDLYWAYHDPEKKPLDYDGRVRAIEEELSKLLRERQLKDAENQRLLKHLRRHHKRNNLLRFLHEPDVIEPTNNIAEQALRPAVIARKVSHCSKNQKGADAFSAFKSVIQTIKKQGGDVLEALADLIRPAPPPEPDFQASN